MSAPMLPDACFAIAAHLGAVQCLPFRSCCREAKSCLALDWLIYSVHNQISRFSRDERLLPDSAFAVESYCVRTNCWHQCSPLPVRAKSLGATLGAHCGCVSLVERMTRMMLHLLRSTRSAHARLPQVYRTPICQIRGCWSEIFERKSGRTVEQCNGRAVKTIEW